jgi:hypothetical protein
MSVLLNSRIDQLFLNVHFFVAGGIFLVLQNTSSPLDGQQEKMRAYHISCRQFLTEHHQPSGTVSIQIQGGGF